MTQLIKVSAKEIKKTDGTGSFISCSAKIGEKWYKIKFTKECTTDIKKRGLYDLKVNVDDISRQKGREKTLKGGKKVMDNDTLWIRKVVSLRKYTEEEMAELNRRDLDEVFGGYATVENDEELPL